MKSKLTSFFCAYLATDIFPYLLVKEALALLNADMSKSRVEECVAAPPAQIKRQGRKYRQGKNKAKIYKKTKTKDRESIAASASVGNLNSSATSNNDGKNCPPMIVKTALMLSFLFFGVTGIFGVQGQCQPPHCSLTMVQENQFPKAEVIRT